MSDRAEPRAEPALPRLLKGISGRGRMSLEQHLATHGGLPLFERSRREEHPLIGEAERAGLRGHGGAGFPFCTKLRSVASSRGRPIVLVNGTEGEPTSRKDKLLLARLPHLVLDGAVLAAGILEADEVVVAVEEYAHDEAESVVAAIAERLGAERRNITIRLAHIPDGYVPGQETAVVNAINGRASKPSSTPPYPSQRGIARRPTLINNVETLAQFALIARHGAAWFRSIGTRDEPGSRLITITGAVARPGVLEVENGTSLQALMNAAGGATGALRGILLGGYAGTWLEPDVSAVRLEEQWLRKRGATLGAGIAVALPAEVCAVAEVARVARWLADESAGQCGPCLHGLEAIASSLGELVEGGDRSGAYSHLKRWCTLVSGRGACAHPDGAARFVRSALRVFAAEFEDHARHGRCAGCESAPVLALPSWYMEAVA